MSSEKTNPTKRYSTHVGFKNTTEINPRLLKIAPKESFRPNKKTLISNEPINLVQKMENHDSAVFCLVLFTKLFLDFAKTGFKLISLK